MDNKDFFNNPFIMNIAQSYFKKFITDKDYQEKLLKDLENLDKKLDKIKKEKNENEKKNNK